MKKLISIGITMSFLVFSSLAFGQQVTPEQIKQGKTDAKTNPQISKKSATPAKKIRPAKKPLKQVPAKSIYREKTSSEMK